jgi:hypothetical protein
VGTNDTARGIICPFVDDGGKEAIAVSLWDFSFTIPKERV